ncbi:MAG TPA: helix-turn-helix domain-containing protein, partial [Roseiflexaceae bacterium]
MDYTTSFGYWLRRRRKALDLTQDELARQAGCATATIKKIEADERRPSRQLAERFADLLDVPADERLVFLKAARAELTADRLAITTQPAMPPALTAPLPQPATALPAGIVTFLFTDIAGSTQLWERYPQAMPAILARHDALLSDTVTLHGGTVFKTVGDAVCAAFARPAAALAAASAAQRAIETESWDDFIGPNDAQAPIELRVRMALHSGAADERDGDYFGPPLNRLARLLAVGHGGQILLSLATEQLLSDRLPPGVELHDLGTYRLKDLTRPEQIFQLVAADLPNTFPALTTLETRPHNLPAQPTALIGREREIADVAALLRRADVRLVTLSGPGGTGKTRLALQVAADLLDNASAPRPPRRERGSGGEGLFPNGVWFVNLAPISDPALIATAIAHTLGLKEIGSQPLLDSLKAYLRTKQLLLVLDNFEQVLAAAELVAELLAAAAQL